MPVTSALEQQLGELVVECSWGQWASLGAPIVQTRATLPTSVVDPEALLMLTPLAARTESRLNDVLVSWASHSASLISVKRYSSLARFFPHRSLVGIADFAAVAVDGGDRRWRALASGAQENVRPRFLDDVASWSTDLRRTSALLLRLRAGFGHGAKIDSLAYLIGLAGQPATASEIGDETRYSAAALRTALSDMVNAAFVRETGGRPNRYYVADDPWIALLTGVELDGRPYAWRSWYRIFAFFGGMLDLLRESDDESEFMLASRVRELHESHRGALELAGVPLPEPRSHKGPRYLGALLDGMSSLRQWVSAAL